MNKVLKLHDNQVRIDPPESQPSESGVNVCMSKVIDMGDNMQQKLNICVGDTVYLSYYDKKTIDGEDYYTAFVDSTMLFFGEKKKLRKNCITVWHPVFEDDDFDIDKPIKMIKSMIGIHIEKEDEVSVSTMDLTEPHSR